MKTKFEQLFKITDHGLASVILHLIAREWEIGDGLGNGREKYVGTFPNKEACYLYCKYHMSADGATVDAPTEKKCYCEYGMTRRNSNSDYKSSYIRRY